MALICYHASHEQFAPSHLLQLIQQAEQAGFDGIHSSDHFHPWSERQGQSGFSFAWIGAAMQATHLPFSMVCAPGQRYHPAIVAQAIGTLAEMFPGRFSIELGSGEAINESITGDEWPQKNERNARLQECADIIRRLLSGETVSHKGYTTIREAKLYTRPSSMPLLLCAALSKETAQWCAPWADGLLTTAEKTIDDTNNKLNVFRGAGGKGKPVHLQYAFSYAPNEQEAIDGAFDQWRSNLVPAGKLADVHTTKEFDDLSRSVSKDDVRNALPIYTNIKDLLAFIGLLAATGAERIILHNVNREQEQFIRDFGAARSSPGH